ncbi:MAG TPA: PIG-L family deacetylase [Terriglobales bacterium]|jgi:LmbE family N-acetylglucosaminyl deacetylase|nr:PIG-L family deacetylase [Terriglobales bacterium]
MFRLMCITAHPDDEAGGFGGTLLNYAERGVETSVVCLTPGQAATNRGEARNDQELAELRRKEFAASCEILKVSRPMILNYPDGQLYRQELNRVVYDLTMRIREFRPQLVITFGAEGGVTGHPDHSMAGIFATLAFHWAGRPNRYADQLKNGLTPHRAQKLYYGTADFALPNRPPITFTPQTAAIDIKKYLDTKISAFKAHKTQAPLWPLFEQNARRRDRELYHLAASVNAGELHPETDLFADVEQGS